MKSSQLVLLPHRIQSDGAVVLSSEWLMHGNKLHEFSFRIPAEHYDAGMEQNASPHLLAMLMPVMRVGGQLRVSAALDQQLVRNLDAFMHYWVRWCPEFFRRVEIVPDQWQSVDADEDGEPGLISCFSGGIDSWYSCLRVAADEGVPLKSLLFLHGHDLDFHQLDQFHGLADNYEKTLQMRSLNMIRVETNAQETAKKFQLSWPKMAHGIQLAAALHLFSHRHTLASIPSSDIVSTLIYPWGSNPVTDPLLSSSRMTVCYHDCQVSRFAKILEVVQHDDVLGSLRVCYKSDAEPLNCGRCVKCLSTIMMMHVAKPNCWKKDFLQVDSWSQVLQSMSRMKLPRWVLEHLEYAYDHALRFGDPEMARELGAVMMRQQRFSMSFRLKARRWFYQKKVLLYTKYPSLIKGA